MLRKAKSTQCTSTQMDCKHHKKQTDRHFDHLMVPKTHPGWGTMTLIATHDVPTWMLLTDLILVGMKMHWWQRTRMIELMRLLHCHSHPLLLPIALLPVLFVSAF